MQKNDIIRKATVGVAQQASEMIPFSFPSGREILRGQEVTFIEIQAFRAGKRRLAKQQTSVQFSLDTARLSPSTRGPIQDLHEAPIRTNTKSKPIHKDLTKLVRNDKRSTLAGTKVLQEWFLIDAVDSAFATFKFYCQPTETLRRFQTLSLGESLQLVGTSRRPASCSPRRAVPGAAVQRAIFKPKAQSFGLRGQDDRAEQQRSKASRGNQGLTKSNESMISELCEDRDIEIMPSRLPQPSKLLRDGPMMGLSARPLPPLPGYH